MKKLIFYCQYLSGMGHLIRSTVLVNALSEHFQVMLVIGGPKIKDFEESRVARIEYLPPLWLEGGVLKVPEGSFGVENVKRRRKERLLALTDEFSPDVVMTEFFPFGRHDLSFELIPWMEQIKHQHPDTLVLSSLRDLIGKTVLHKQIDLISGLVEKYFHGVFVHSDESFLSFQESFPEPEAIHCPIFHSGFVAQDISPNQYAAEKPFILVSIGGGRIGAELLYASVEVAKKFLDSEYPYEFRIFAGPFMDDTQYAELKRVSSDLKNVHLERFTPNLTAYMSSAALSISCAGYNTTMNVLRAKVPAILIPFGHYDFDKEQAIRAIRLEGIGAVKVIMPKDLSIDHLACTIRSELEREHPEPVIDLDGAIKTSEKIKQLVDKKELITQ